MQENKLSFSHIREIAHELNAEIKNSYTVSYVEFVKYFKDLPVIESHHFIIGSHFVYGWMPTINKMKVVDVEKILPLLNKAKEAGGGDWLSKEEIGSIKAAVNNSLVGTSKLLHFINPDVYAIWDSKIYKYVTRKSHAYGIGDIDQYLSYCRKLFEISKHDDFESLHMRIKDYAGEVTAMRAIEIVMFEKCNREAAKNKIALQQLV